MGSKETKIFTLQLLTIVLTFLFYKIDSTAHAHLQGILFNFTFFLITLIHILILIIMFCFYKNKSYLAKQNNKRHKFALLSEVIVIISLLYLFVVFLFYLLFFINQPLLFQYL